MFTFTCDTSCMLVVLMRKGSKRTYIPLSAQRRYCAAQSPLQQRMDQLENQAKLIAIEHARIKEQLARLETKVTRLHNNYISPSYENLPQIHDSYIDKHNMHYGNTTH